MSRADARASEDILRWGDARGREAERVMERLDLSRRWSEYGQPIIVGALAYGLVGRPDIDLEIYCQQPRIEHGFAVVADLALVPGVRKVRYSNELEGPDRGLYWQLRYRDDESPMRELWKIDMWLLGHDHPGPLARDLIEPMQRALSNETRAAILTIKRATLADARLRSIDVYRAVLDGGARTVPEVTAWLAEHDTSGLTRWRPGLDMLPEAGCQDPR